jgi:hypothetical protein
MHFLFLFRFDDASVNNFYIGTKYQLNSNFIPSLMDMHSRYKLILHEQPMKIM